MKNQELIKLAAAVVKTKKTKDGLWADIGCALLSESGKIYTGVCAAAGSNTFCAEQIAIGAMITDGEYKIAKIVAVHKDESGAVFVIPPCGNCRQVMRETEESNLENTEIVLDKNKSVKLEELLPYYDWWKKQE
ncbi:cytidine deaminase [Candidatus Falkowbacteria bacterium CG11_big_fil_rev_8_21_14_0_20_39_10]|uniref:Cytidine deaminase n=1 Tax=Candidatus Falkowbacteria bacterium CG11_big_fil_rev_8_21_14_0_20_39_10 TaxID=1974570 RepID=A0A2M6KAB9_9BACT|nr:MAG: cytidine deaminase [Candidatus Falkowbacteria bacterium CG11_big_fil_rev_8_21_14_0_20_39_10]